MKPTELRIGNLINPSSPIMVEAWMLMPETGIIFMPIPLTEEWLLKFGFKTRTTVNHSVQYFIGENPLTRDWLLDILWLNGYEYPFYRNGFFKIKYVHQLQNLFFALTAEELEIKQIPKFPEDRIEHSSTF